MVSHAKSGVMLPRRSLREAEWLWDAGVAVSRKRGGALGGHLPFGEAKKCERGSQSRVDSVLSALMVYSKALSALMKNSLPHPLSLEASG